MGDGISDDAYQLVAHEFLSDETLRRLTGAHDLESVSYLEMSADTSELTLSELGRRLPSLEQLRMSGSNVATLRDLGTGLAKLQEHTTSCGARCVSRMFVLLDAAILRIPDRYRHDFRWRWSAAIGQMWCTRVRRCCGLRAAGCKTWRASARCRSCASFTSPSTT
eukprot:2348083-Pleurochrysis_carterae.AAC.2